MRHTQSEKSYQNCGRPVMSSSSESTTMSRLALLLLHPGLVLAGGLFFAAILVGAFLLARGGGLVDLVFVANARRVCSVERTF